MLIEIAEHVLRVEISEELIVTLIVIISTYMKKIK